MRKRKKQEFKINYGYVPNTILLEQSFEILSKHFYKNEKRIKEKLKEKPQEVKN